MNPTVVVSVIEDSFAAASEKLDRSRALGVSRVQVDVCDGRFVFRKTLSDVSTLDSTGLQLEYHLMCERPAEWLSGLSRPWRAIAHVERGAAEVEAFLAGCRARGISPALAINPETPWVRLKPFLSQIDMVTVMGVHPGWAGQAFLGFVLGKVRALREKFPGLEIQLDGGMGLVKNPESSTIFSGAQAGVHSFIVSSAFWGAIDREKILAEFERVARLGSAAYLPRAKLSDSEQRVFLSAYRLRKNVVEMVARAKSGHVGGGLGMAEVFAVLFDRMKLDPRRPLDSSRDRLLVSNGHIGAIWYAALASKGFFPSEELLSFRQPDSRLQGHPHVGSLPGIENSGGPLGQGTSQAVGRALALRLANNPARVYCVTGDGELDEGQCWEAFLSAAKFRLSNLVFLVDRNDIQIDDVTQNVLPLEPLGDKLRSFNLHVIEIDANEPSEVVRALDEAQAFELGPTAIVCHCVSGKGVSLFEGDFKWHGTPPSFEQAVSAQSELDAALRRIESGSWP